MAGEGGEDRIPSKEEIVEELVRDGAIDEWSRDIALFLLDCVERGRCRPRSSRERRWLRNLKRARCATRDGVLVGDAYFLENGYLDMQLNVWILCAIGLLEIVPPRSRRGVRG